jgi:hypothetical protein
MLLQWVSQGKRNIIHWIMPLRRLWNELIPSHASLRAAGGENLRRAMSVASVERERFAHVEPWPLGEPLPGQRQSVKALSREAGSRPATALTDWPWSGLFAVSGLAHIWAKYGWMALGSLKCWIPSAKRMARAFGRLLKNSKHSNHMHPADGGAFTLPSKSSVQSVLHATIFPSFETVLRTSAGLRFLRMSTARRRVSQRSPNRRSPVSHLGDGREAQFAISWPVEERLVCNGRLRTVVCERLFG